MPLDIAALKSTDVGREVRYETFGKVEFGRISSWNEHYIFVRYHTAVLGHPPKQRSLARTGSTSEATAPQDLEFCE